MLTDTHIRTAKPQERPYKLADSRGLILEVKPNGSKLWRYRYRIAGKETMLGLGDYPAISLAAARKQRDAARELVKQGIHPALHRQQQKRRRLAEQTNTFEGVARELIGKKAWTPLTHVQNLRIFETEIFPRIGDMPIRAVLPADLLIIIQQVERRGAHTIALKIRALAGEVFRYGCATLRCDADPAAALRGAIQAPPTEHCAPFTHAELGHLLDALAGYGGERITAIAVLLLLLTFVRTTELQAARWDEFDLAAALWRIPGDRMKMKTDHVVPLSRQAVALLRELQILTGQQSWLFPNARNPRTHMQRTTFNRVLEYVGLPEHSGHDFRATASTYLHEMGFRPDLIERQLGHQERNKVRASYNHAQYLEERRAMMQQYADFVFSASGRDNIVPIRQSAA